jgi:hypothetical protein
MTFTDPQTDELLALVARMKTHDVSPRRAGDLRKHCHAELQARTQRDGPFSTALRRFIGPALGGAWSLAYLIEVIRHAVAAYQF